MPIRKINLFTLITSLAVTILACRLANSPPTPTTRSTQTLAPTPTIKIIIPPRPVFPSQNGREMGDANAPVTIEIYSDFQCPACRQFATSVEPQIVQQYVTTGKVHLIYRHFPFLGDESMLAARASMCAAEQNLFWDYHAILFANLAGENQGTFRQENLLAFANAIGVDPGAFPACVEAKRYQSIIDEDLQQGKSKGVTGVPSVFVDDKLITPGHLPGLKDMQEAIDAALGSP